MKVLSVNIGERKEVQWRKKTIETGIFKFPVNKAIFLDKEDVRGDVVVDRKHHAGIDKAVYLYGAQHYDYFKELYPNQDWQYGIFGENITLAELDETKLHIGSVYQLGEAKIEVSKPRQPCYKLGIRFNDQKIVKDFWHSTKSGSYFKILETGNVKAGDKLVLIENKLENPTIAEVYTDKRASRGL